MGVFENVSYEELAARFIELDKALKPENPLGISADQALNMHKAFGVSYFNLTDNLTTLQKMNAPQLMEIASKRLVNFELSHVNIGEPQSDR